MNHSKCEQMTHKNRNLFQISNINIPSGTQISNLSLNPSNFQMKVKDGWQQASFKVNVTINRMEISKSSSANHFRLCI